MDPLFGYGTFAFLLAPGRQRDRLLVVGAGLYAAFPMVHVIFLPAFHLPVVLLLIGLIFRGVAFVQGAVAGAMVQGLPVAGNVLDAVSRAWTLGRWSTKLQ